MERGHQGPLGSQGLGGSPTSAGDVAGGGGGSGSGHNGEAGVGGGGARFGQDMQALVTVDGEGHLSLVLRHMDAIMGVAVALCSQGQAGQRRGLHQADC